MGNFSFIDPRDGLILQVWKQKLRRAKQPWLAQGECGGPGAMPGRRGSRALSPARDEGQQGSPCRGGHQDWEKGLKAVVGKLL